jgi:CHAT domain-containing protein
MRLRPLRSWGLWLTLVLFLPSILRAQGVVIETVAAASALEKAGAREGDVFRAWTRPANPPINPEPASGTLPSPFDWQWLEIEQAPRGPVELRGVRQGEPLVLQVPIGLWAAEVRPVLPAELEDLYRRGKELVDKEQVEKGVTCWQQVAERAGGGGDWRLRVWVWLRIATTWDKAGGFEKAATAYEAALRESREPLSRVAVLEARGASFADQERLAEAEASYRSAFELRKATWGESLQLARSTQGLGQISLFRSYFAAAPERRSQLLAAAQEQIEGALAIRERWAPRGVAAAGCLDDLGLISYLRGDLNKATMCFDSSISISALLQPVSLDMAMALFHRGYISLLRGEFAKAQALCQQALSAMGRTTVGPWMEEILTNLGIVTMMRGDLVGAEDYLRRALLLESKRLPESASMSALLNSLGLVALQRLDLDSAQEYFERSLQLRLRIAPGTRDVAWSLSLLGNVAKERGDLKSAERYFRESLAECEQFTELDDLIDNILAGLAEIARERGDLAAVESCYHRSLKYKRLTASKPILLALGETAFQLGRLQEAESYLREFLGRDGQSPSTYWRHANAFEVLANVLRRMGRLQEAARYADLAIESLEAQIDKLGGSQETKGKVRARNGDIYRDALRLQLELGRPQEAFHRLERFRAQAFLALLAERDLTFADLPPELDQERHRLAASYDRNQLQLTELDAKKDRAAIEALQREQVQLRRRRDEIAGEMRRTAPRLAALQYPQALTFEQVREALDPGTVMLSYSAGKEQTHLFIITPGRELQVETLKVGREALEKDIDSFRRLIDQTRTGSALGTQGLDWFSRRLYDLLVEPAEPWLAAGKRIVLVPDGPLHLLPFAALTRKDGRHLVEWKPLSTVLSGTVFAELKKQRRDAVAGAQTSSLQWVAFGDPWFPPRLAQGRPEDLRDTVCALSPPAGSCGGSACRRAAGRSKRSPRCFPPAAAGPTSTAKLPKSAPRRSGGTRGSSTSPPTPTWTTVRPSIRGWCSPSRRSSPRGATTGFSRSGRSSRACGWTQTWWCSRPATPGSGRSAAAKGSSGSPGPFNTRGARSVLASLWRVEDEATAELMERFYRHLRAGKAKDEALRAAQLELIRRPLRVQDGRGGWTERNAAAPYFWAALQLFGDGR